MMRKDVSPVCQKSPGSQHLPPVLVQDWFSALSVDGNILPARSLGSLFGYGSVSFLS